LDEVVCLRFISTFKLKLQIKESKIGYKCK
jgi:hypothetical protein